MSTSPALHGGDGVRAGETYTVTPTPAQMVRLLRLNTNGLEVVDVAG